MELPTHEYDVNASKKQKMDLSNHISETLHRTSVTTTE